MGGWCVGYRRLARGGRGGGGIGEAIHRRICRRVLAKGRGYVDWGSRSICSLFRSSGGCGRAVDPESIDSVRGEDAKTHCVLCGEKRRKHVQTDPQICGCGAPAQAAPPAQPAVCHVMGNDAVAHSFMCGRAIAATSLQLPIRRDLHACPCNIATPHNQQLIKPQSPAIPPAAPAVDTTPPALTTPAPPARRLDATTEKAKNERFQRCWPHNNTGLGMRLFASFQSHATTPKNQNMGLFFLQ